MFVALQQQAVTHQVQAATQTPQSSAIGDAKKQIKTGPIPEGVKVKKGRLLLRNQVQPQPGAAAFQQSANQNFQIDPNSGKKGYCRIINTFTHTGCLV